MSVSREKERAAMAAAVRAADVIFLLHVSLCLIKWTSPVDVGGFAEPRKILCQCALPSDEQLSVHPRSAHGGAGVPNNWYQSTWFKGVFDFCSKMKVVKIVF